MHDRARGGGLPFSGRLFEGPPEARPDADGAAHAARPGPHRPVADRPGADQPGADQSGPGRPGAGRADGPDGECGRGGPYGFGPGPDGRVRAAGAASRSGSTGDGSADDWPEVERRHPPDRRSGLDRRGSGWHAPLQAEPRPYGFREFRARRAVQDRRLYIEDCGSWDAFARRAQRRAQQPAGAARDGFVTLTPEEIVVLLAEADD